MVTHKKVITKITSFLALVLLLLNNSNVFAVEENVNFNVNVKEVLSVSVATPDSWAAGEIDTFLRNKVSLNVVTNNENGFTATMTTKTTNTSLINTSKNTYTLPTLASTTTRASFPANFWGYSLDDTENGNGASTYSALVGAGSTPITILSSNSASSGSRDFYFGAKGNATLPAGTYSGSVIISVVTGVIDPQDNPITPVNPDTPNPTPNTPTYNPTRDTTSYSYNTSSGSGASARTSTTTEISAGDNRSAYQGYTPPQGVTYTTTSEGTGLPGLTTGLGIASSVALASGIFFLFAARREEDDDEEEEQQS